MAETSIEEIEIVDPDKFYPIPQLKSDDDSSAIPFSFLPGEGGVHKGKTSEGPIILTNYRLYHSEGTYFNIPLGLIDYVECKDIFYLFIYCKDGRIFRCIFDNNEDSQKWLKRLQNASQPSEKMDNNFCFYYYSWTRNAQKENITSLANAFDVKDPMISIIAEAERMGFDLKNVWKITKINENYQLCPSYPPYFIVPTSIHEDDLIEIANFRYSKRIPAVVWRHQQNGCVIARSSQPRMGIWGWRNELDEKLIQAISDACVSDPGHEGRVNGREESFSLKSDVDGDISIFCGQSEDKKVQKKLLIIDARSYAAAMTNRAKGGGYESDGYYFNSEMQYMGLANIHTIRSSFNGLRALCAAPDELNWLSALESTKWLNHISGLIRAALLVVNAIDIEKRPVLVHCSDGWDRTPQIVALAEIMLDPFYRTKKGFQILVEREWLEFGHKFADRCGHSNGTDDRNERSPVFLQWLDCIYQLLEQFQCHFEFNHQYLIRLALHTYSCLFGTFLCNTHQARKDNSVPRRTFSVWPVLNEKSQFHNFLFNHSNEVLRPSYQIRCLKFWSDVYLPNNSINLGKSTLPPVEVLLEENSQNTNLVKTKSCDNISSAGISPTLQRRNSDPNIVKKLHNGLVLEHPQVTETSCNILTFLQSSNETIDLEVSNICSDIGFNVDTNKSNNDAERTGIVSNLGFVLREPAIDGSTDTLVNESGILALDSNVSEIEAEVSKSTSNYLSSVATSTSDLLVAVDGAVQSSGLQNTNCIDSRLSDWCQSFLDAYYCNKRNGDSSNSCSCSYATPNHSRTPSSGFPATPCDDPSDVPNLKNGATHQILDVDGLNIVPNAVQERIKKLILHYKNKVGNLQCELSSARSEFIHHICRHYAKDAHTIDGDDAPSLADSACSGEQYIESGGSDSSWDLLWSSDHGTTNCVV